MAKSHLNILLLIDGLPGGGAEKVVLTLAEGFHQEGHAVTLISLREVCEYSIPSGINYELCLDPAMGNCTDFLQRFWPPWGEVSRRAAGLEKVLQGRKWDLILSHLPKTDRIVAATPSLKNAWFCLHEAFIAGRLGKKRGFARWRKKQQLQQLYRGRNVLTVSRGIASELPLLDITPARLATIYNPFDLEKIVQLSQEPCPYKGDLFLLHVGRFDPQKRHDRLLAAFAQTDFSRLGGKLILLGQGSAQAEKQVYQCIAHHQLEEQVILEGFVNNPYRYMRVAQALIVSSDYEGLPTVLIEALACGTQVISTNCPYGPEEILSGPLVGGLSPLSSKEQDSVSNLARAIDHTLKNRIAITTNLLNRFRLDQSIKAYLALV